MVGPRNPRAFQDHQLGIDTLKANELTSEAEAEKLIKETEEAGKAWGKLSGHERAEILRKVGKAIALRRGDLLEVMAAEAGKTLEQGDTEVSEAIDFAYYYAMLAEDLEKIDGAKPKSVDLTLVVPRGTSRPLSPPVVFWQVWLQVLLSSSSPQPSPLAPVPSSQRSCGMQAFPKEVLKLVKVVDRAAGKLLISHPEVDRLILTGGYETAELFRSWRDDLPCSVRPRVELNHRHPER